MLEHESISEKKEEPLVLLCLRQMRIAIENGEKIEDERGVVYRQEFGEAFLKLIDDSMAELTDIVESARSCMCADRGCKITETSPESAV